MAVSALAQRTALLSLAAASATAASVSPSDELSQLLENPPFVSEEDAQLAAQLKDSMIDFFRLEPIHLDQKAESQSEGSQKQRKQKHGRVVQYDLGGQGWDWGDF